MRDAERLAARVVGALERDPSIHVREEPLWAAVSEDGAVAIAGEVTDLASKRRACARVGALEGVRRVVDRVRVAPATPMQDGALRDRVRDALVGEPALLECSILVAHDGGQETARDAGPGARGSVHVSVEGGAVALDGFVPTLAHKRLAETLAWWVPVTCDVRNDLGVSTPEEDSDAELSDAVRFVLEKEPFVDAAQLRVDTRSGEVTLRGTLPSDEQRAIAERDAWCVPGVRDVVDRIELTSHP